MRNGVISSVARLHHVPRTTLWSQWTAFTRWRSEGLSEAAALQKADGEHRGGHNRLLQPADEQQWAADVRAAARTGDALVPAQCIDLAIQRVAAAHGPVTRAHPLPSLNPSWLFPAMHRHDLRTGAPRCRDNQGPPDSELTVAYVAECQKWMEIVGAELMINWDEVHWHLANPPRKVVGPVGEPLVLHPGADIRHGFSVGFTVTAAGHKLPPVVMKRVKTERGLAAEKKQYGASATFVAVPGGWTNSDVMVHLVETVFAPFTAGRQAVLVMDVGSGHATEEVCAALAKHFIHVIWVPPRGTGDFQPLDVSVNGVVRAKARRVWSERYRGLGPGQRCPLTQFEAIGDCLAVWKEIDTRTIVKGFLDGMRLPTAPIAPTRGPIVSLVRAWRSHFRWWRLAVSDDGVVTIHLSRVLDHPGTPLYSINTFPAPRREYKKQAKRLKQE